MTSRIQPQALSAAPDPLRLLRFVPGAARRVLDFGCGAGERIEALKTRGAIEVVGVETEVAATVPADALVTGPLDTVEVPRPAGHFDCILSDGAFARLRDPARVLARFRNLLAPGGLLLLSAPNVQHHSLFTALVLGQWAYAPDGPFPFEQIRFYTGYELHRLVGARGFTDLRLTALVRDPETDFPLGPDGMVRLGRMSLGPLTAQEHTAFLVREYLVLARAPEQRVG